MHNLYYLNRKKESFIDDLVYDWNNALVAKLQEMDNQFGRQAAYTFYSKICNHTEVESKDIVDSFLDN